MIAYLVVREGNKWRDVYRLTPGQVTTVGRGATNRIVLHDDVCSRHHCEVFQNSGQWTLRDLGSRNGTLIDGTSVAGDIELKPGQLIQIGPTDLAFTNDLSQAFPKLPDEPIESDTDLASESVLETPPPSTEPTIIHRANESRFALESQGGMLGRDRMSRDLAQLYRLALQMGSATTATQLAEVVLAGLSAGTSADIGAVLLLARPVGQGERPGDLTVVAYKSRVDLPYQKVSEYLSRTVLTNREAVLALRDVADDSRLVNRDSLGEIHAKGVICAPIRSGQLLYGLVHLYSTSTDRTLEPDDLQFTLAVANQCAVALDNMRRRESLADGLARVRDENLKLREELGVDNELVGASQTMGDLKRKISRIAATDATVLIRGESGVGKELVARAIHFGSPRRPSPFITMNCAALTESLLESELFGHEKGSFTGATGRKIGKFEQAHRGTLMLDEVGEMPLPIQAKFLRVLEGHPFERVGGGTSVQVDVRVVAATNRELEKAVEEGLFRKDLYFRLHVVEIVVPSLRDHPADIPVLASHFVERYSRKTGRNISGFSPSAIDKLMAYHWPGNIRELQNTIERAVILSVGELVLPSDIQLSHLGNSEDKEVEIVATTAFQPMTLDDLEQRHILATLEMTGWNKSQAAQILGIERSTLDRKLKKYQVDRPGKDDPVESRRQ